MSETTSSFHLKPDIRSVLGKFVFIVIGAIAFYQYYWGKGIDDDRYFLGGLGFTGFGILVILYTTNDFTVDTSTKQLIIEKMFLPGKKQYDLGQLEQVKIREKYNNPLSRWGILPASGYIIFTFSQNKKISIVRIFNSRDFDKFAAYLEDHYPDITETM